MRDLLAEGQKWLSSQLYQHMSREIIYRRNELSVLIRATIGKSMYDQDDGEGILPHDRSQNRYHCRVDIAVQKKFSHGTNQEIDALVDLGEKIADEFRLKRLLSFQAARCIKVEQTVLYSTEHWEQLRQFTSLMTLTFELSR